MSLITSLSYIISWLREPVTGAWQAAEPVLAALYLAFLLFC